MKRVISCLSDLLSLAYINVVILDSVKKYITTHFVPILSFYDKIDYNTLLYLNLRSIEDR